MAGSSSSASPPSLPSPATTPASITDLNDDSIGHCATYLSLRDVCNMAMSSTALKRLTYSDSVWHRLFTKRWPNQQLIPSGGTVSRGLYLSRYTALQQFRFRDPKVHHVITRSANPYDHLLLHQNHVYFTRGSSVGLINLDNYQSSAVDVIHYINEHIARITCMRLFSLEGQNILATSSRDHSISLWCKGSTFQCLGAHNGPVLSLSNKLLGEDKSKILASGGEDGTVRLWSLSSNFKQGQHGLKATLYGHEKPVDLISVSGHKTSLLVTISRDSKVRVWDTATSSADSSSCCVGMTSVPGAPVNMKCHDSLVYVAAGSSVTAVDLRTMRKVITAAVHPPELYSFDVNPSKFLICTGGDGRALLWDIRRNQELPKPEPVAELDGHWGSVTKLYMDQYKIVTGGLGDAYVNVWEVGTGEHTNCLLCSLAEEEGGGIAGCDAMAVDEFRIITATSWGDFGVDSAVLCFRDFNNATRPVTKKENSKFVESESEGSGDDIDR